jgi:hypothetical protein
MNIVRRHVVRLVAICAFATTIPQLASATDSSSGATLQLAMGPMSAAQKNQGNVAKPHDATAEPRRHSRHRHARHAK